MVWCNTFGNVFVLNYSKNCDTLIKIANKAEYVNKHYLIKSVCIYMPVYMTDYVTVCAYARFLALALVMYLIGVRL